MKPTDAAYIAIPEAALLARDPGGQYTEIRKALDIADQLMLRAIDVTDRDGREPYLLPASAITTLAQMVEMLESKLATAAVIVAWANGELSEGQAAKTLRLNRVVVREVFDDLQSKGLAAADMAKAAKS